MANSWLGSASLPGRASSWLCLHAFQALPLQLLLLHCRSCDPACIAGRGRGRVSKASERPTSGGGQALSISFNLNPVTHTQSPGNESDWKDEPIHRLRTRRSLSISPRYSLVAVGRPQSCFLLCPFARVLLAAKCQLPPVRWQSVVRQPSSGAAVRPRP